MQSFLVEYWLLPGQREEKVTLKMFILRIFGRVQPQLHEKRLAIGQPVVSGRFRGSPLAGRLVASCVGPLKITPGPEYLT